MNIITLHQVTELSRLFGICVQREVNLAGDENAQKQNDNSHTSLNNRHIMRLLSSLYKITVLQFKTQSTPLNVY
jgi:hypothetical protein